MSPAPTPLADGESTSKQSNENKKMKMSCDEGKATSNTSQSKQQVEQMECEQSISSCDDEVAAEAFREEQELVFHASKTSKASNLSTFDDTRSLRVDPVKGSGHEGRLFPNLIDDTSLVTKRETTSSLRTNYITGISSSPMSKESGKQASISTSKTHKSVASSGSTRDVLLLYCGLANDDGRCSFANAVIQLLYSWKSIPLYIRSSKDDIPPSVTPSLHRSLDALFQTMGSVSGGSDRAAAGKAKVVDSKNFMADFRTIAAARGKVTAPESAVDFLESILQILHSEVNKASPGNAAVASAQVASSITSAEKAWEDKVNSEDDSFLVHLIKGQLQSTVLCLTCGAKTSLTWSAFWTLTLPLPLEMSEKKELTLSDCLQHYLAVQILNADEKTAVKCSECSSGRSGKVSKQLSVSRAPQFLLIYLDRLSYASGGKDAPDSRPVLIEPKMKVGGREYSLLSAILKNSGAHYVTLHAQHTQKWILFDDQSVSVISAGYGAPPATPGPSEDTAQDLMRKYAYLLLFKANN